MAFSGQDLNRHEPGLHHGCETLVLVALIVRTVRGLPEHRHRFGESLGLVIDTARPDWVDIPPVRFLLRVLEWVPVDLRCGRQDERGVLGLRQTERLVGAEGTDLEGRDRNLEVVDRAGWTRPVQHEVDRTVEVDVFGDIVLDEQEIAGYEGRDVGHVPGEEIVDADHGMAAIEQGLGQMGADETGGAGNDHSCAHVWIGDVQGDASVRTG